MPKWEVDTDTIISEYKMEQDEWVEEETQEENISDGNPIIANLPGVAASNPSKNIVEVLFTCFPYPRNAL